MKEDVKCNECKKRRVCKHVNDYMNQVKFAYDYNKEPHIQGPFNVRTTVESDCDEFDQDIIILDDKQ